MSSKIYESSAITISQSSNNRKFSKTWQFPFMKLFSIKAFFLFIWMAEILFPHHENLEHTLLVNPNNNKIDCYCFNWAFTFNIKGLKLTIYILFSSFFLSCFISKLVLRFDGAFLKDSQKFAFGILLLAFHTHLPWYNWHYNCTILGA